MIPAGYEHEHPCCGAPCVVCHRPVRGVVYGRRVSRFRVFRASWSCSFAVWHLGCADRAPAAS